MGEARFEQSNFTQGQLDAKAHARTDWEQYYKSVKTASNCIVEPQGGITRRWGTTYVDSVAAARKDAIEISTFQYDENTLYLLVWYETVLKIYLENQLVDTVVTTFMADDITLLRFSQVLNRYIIANENFVPKQLTRSANAANIITGVDTTNNYITITNALTVGSVYPIKFTTAGTLPTTNPQIYVGRTYFIRVMAANSVRVYATSLDAINDENYFIISGAGAGVSNVVLQNTWSLSDIAFKFKPAYDFDGGYSGASFTFTPSVTTGAVQITASANIFTLEMEGGLYRGNGGIVRITQYVSATVVNGYTIQDFPNTNAIRGDLSFLGEPAWSATRGYPRTVSFFQNRMVFGGSPSITNGIWASVINDVYNFDDSQTLDDDAISWYPNSSSNNTVLALTATKSLIVHTNTGNWSTPVLTEIAITPKNFVLTEQNKFGIRDIQPVFIDNQILFADTSGSNIIQMVWDIGQSSYVTDNCSIGASDLIRTPVDMASFSQPQFTDAFYALFVNNDGTLTILQTLAAQGVLAWTPATTQQNYTDGLYTKVTASNNRCWFLVKRYIASNQAPVAITSFSLVDNTLTAVGHGLALDASNLVTFTTTGSLPSTTPALNTTSYFYARGITNDTFKIYSTKDDADNNTNAFTVSSAGTNSNLVRWPDAEVVYVEEVDFTQYTDCTFKLKGVGSATLTGLTSLRGQTIQVKADGYVFPEVQVSPTGTATLNKTVTNANVGLKYTTLIEPLPVAIPGISGILYKPKHFRNLYINYYQTIGATIQGFEIPTMNLQDYVFGAVPSPKDGIFQYTPMNGWESGSNAIQIIQDQPLPMTIRALCWVMETG